MENAYCELPAAASWMPDDVLDGVAGDGDDHEPGERLRDPDRVHGRLERDHEPVGDERRSQTRGGEHPDGQCDRPPRSACDRAAPSRVRWPPGAGRTAVTGRTASSSTTETITENVISCSAAGACTKWAIDGIAHAVTESSIRTTMVRARAEPSCWVPCLRPPTRNARPSTSSRLARIEPDQRGLDHVDQPGPQREDADEQLRQVAERRLQDAGGAGAELVAQLLHRAADQRGQQADRASGEDEREHRVPAGVVRDAGQDDEGTAAPDDDLVGAAEGRRGRMNSGRRHARHAIGADSGLVVSTPPRRFGA